MNAQNKKKYILNILLILSITFLSAYFSIGKNYKEVIAAFKQANVFWIIVMVIIMICYYLFDALSLLFFGRVYKKDFSYKQSFTNAISGTFFSAITPSSSGGQFAQVYVFNKQGISATHSSSILLMCFICYQSVLVIYTSVVVLFNIGFLSANPGIFSLVMIGFLINFIVIFALFGGAKSKRLQNFLIHTVVKLLSKIKIVKNYEETSGKIEQYLADFREQLNFLQHNKSVLMKSCLCNFMKLTIVYSMPFFAAKALNLDVSITQFFQFIGYCSFIYLINAFLPIPGASGGSEACYMLLFGFLGSIGVSSSMTLWRFISYYIGLILGGLIFCFDREINGPGVNGTIKIDDME